jgi:hypothetical protein
MLSSSVGVVGIGSLVTLMFDGLDALMVNNFDLFRRRIGEVWTFGQLLPWSLERTLDLLDQGQVVKLGHSKVQFVVLAYHQPIRYLSRSLLPRPQGINELIGKTSLG